MELNKENIIRIFKQGWLNFRRNSWLAFGTIGTMILALLIFSGLVVFNVLSQNIISDLEGKVDITAYLKKDVNEEEVLKLKKDLEKLPEIEFVNYISSQKALEEFKIRHRSEEIIQQALSELDENPLQASLEIKAKKTNQYASLANFLENSKYKELIDKINFYENEKVIKRVESISNGLKKGGILTTLLLSLIAILVTFNTIRLTIYSQKQEIEIMRLVGASNWYIRGPFLVEGGIYGIIAGLIVLLIFYPILYFVSPKINSLIPSVNLSSYFAKFFGQMLILIVGSGITLGIISSFVAIRKYLRI